jgi:hypothetical protein
MSSTCGSRKSHPKNCCVQMVPFKMCLLPRRYNHVVVVLMLQMGKLHAVVSVGVCDSSNVYTHSHSDVNWLLCLLCFCCDSLRRIGLSCLIYIFWATCTNMRPRWLWWRPPRFRRSHPPLTLRVLPLPTLVITTWVVRWAMVQTILVLDLNAHKPPLITHKGLP